MTRRATLVFATLALCACQADPAEGRDLSEVPPEARAPAEVFRPDLRTESEEDEYPLVPARLIDRRYDRDDPLTVRRLVYHVTVGVPLNLGSGDAALSPPDAELVIDLDLDRARVTFRGDGWPVDAGSEVRIRGDNPGLYLFDGQGGRPLGPGQLAEWFEGGHLRRAATFRISSPPEEEQVGPGALICRLIAEWAGVSPSSTERSCGRGGAPSSFRVGLWRATRTADVDFSAPTHALRADQENPPERPEVVTGRAWLDERSLARVRPMNRRRPRPEEDAPSHGLIIINRSPARMIVTAGGTPLGWINAGTELYFEGLRSGEYAIGAMRPLGLQMAQKRPRIVPGRVSLPR